MEGDWSREGDNGQGVRAYVGVSLLYPRWQMVKARSGAETIEMKKVGEEFKRYLSSLTSERSSGVDKGVREFGNNYKATQTQKPMIQIENAKREERRGNPQVDVGEADVSGFAYKGSDHRLDKWMSLNMDPASSREAGEGIEIGRGIINICFCDCCDI